MLLGLTQIRKAVKWKNEVCPNCEFTNQCPKTSGNLALCLDESLGEEDQDDNLPELEVITSLAKSGLRRFCSIQRKQSRKQQETRARIKYSLPLPFYTYNKEPEKLNEVNNPKKAHLYCADPREYAKCTA